MKIFVIDVPTQKTLINYNIAKLLFIMYLFHLHPTQLVYECVEFVWMVAYVGNGGLGGWVCMCASGIKCVHWWV